VFILLLWIPLRERMGWGTLLNAIEIGLVVFLLGDSLPHTDVLVLRVAYLAGGLLAIGFGSGLSPKAPGTAGTEPNQAARSPCSLGLIECSSHM
jgi:uncharacterized membrane protein YczE